MQASYRSEPENAEHRYVSLECLCFVCNISRNSTSRLQAGGRRAHRAVRSVVLVEVSSAASSRARGSALLVKNTGEFSAGFLGAQGGTLVGQ
jgi:hypothetical protein